MAKEVNAEMIIADLVEIDEDIVPILMACGMHCVGCPSAQGETLEEACFVHGLDAKEVVDTINGYLKNKEEKNEG